jgi:SAM-dependent methyltransferase
MSLPEIEQNFVKCVYEDISEEFSQTRHSVWNRVKLFIDSLDSNSTLFEAGCGNGKNLTYRSNIKTFGCDITEGFVDICVSKNLNVKLGDVTCLDYPNDYFDNTMSVAVIHHLSTKERRIKGIEELVRVTKKGGSIFIEVWAQEQKHSLNKDTKGMEKCRVNFDNRDQDVYIPFKNKINRQVLGKRYYHVFKENELEQLVSNINNVEILERFYEKGNWGVILRKI